MLWILAGPTASGKSALALELSALLPLEIVSADSMQVYRGMDIGTAKPSAGERARVPHHLIDVCDPDGSYDVCRFAQEALTAIADIRRRGKMPLVVGGTGLYIRALTHGIADQLPRDAGLRESLERQSVAELQEELSSMGEHGLNASDFHNKRRLIRAVEICRLTGQSLVAARPRQEWKTPREPYRLFFLNRPSGELHRRIEQRVEAMFAAGLEEECRRLLERFPAKNPTAFQALGYRQVAGLLAGEMTREQCVALVKIRTRQFARRQEQWFRRESALEKISPGSETDPGRIVEYLKKRIQADA
ncbi:MAG: tRNA (adenosine(37)-N6)-dimethylallyltransferase MiaA [Verrucomicrobiae bacterium]|nr:tRNA (adenosine(37)-N6)-dimethylallyltransferase MiaA [Verrucomicrobiae bacterium]